MRPTLADAETDALPNRTPVTQDDEKVVSEVGRSIEALFAGEEESESTATVPLGGAEERHPDVATSLGLEGVLDSAQEPDPTPAPGDAPVEGPEAELGAPADTEDHKKDIPEDDAPEEAAPEDDVPEEAIEAEEKPVELDPALVEIKHALSEATSQYIEAQAREAVQSELRSAVEAASAAGALDEIASTVEVLLLQGAGDPAVEALTVELMDEGVSAEMVARLGRVREEEEREALIQAYVRLGDPIAEAIAAALTETEDRSARKIYVEALGAFGSAGGQAVEKMLQDSRWYVVRNGVAVLGVVGGPSAIEHLMGSLANEHAGVRRETVRSLAKIGGENAGVLVSSMLGDSDPKVRAAAARAVAALKPERAFKQLLEILKKGDEEAVLEEVLRALGALGDPSAVSEIEKRVKASLFSRPPEAVRLAGLTALAAIGTPHAVSLVKKARTDKDSAISAAAARLLSGG